MKLQWTKVGDIPHGFLCATPVHLIYRVRDAAPVGELKRISADLRLQLSDLRASGPADTDALERVLAEYGRVYDALLDAQDQRNFVLHDDRAAQITLGSWQTLQRRGELLLYAACVMGNHVHALFRGPHGEPDRPLGRLVGRHKSYTNHEIRAVIDHATTIWEDGFYDRYVRPGSFWDVLWYILQNPVKAGLTGDWRTWAGTYVDERCLPELEARFGGR